MSEQSSIEPTELEAAIEENPEAVARLVRRLDAVNELLDVLELGESALDDEMVRSLADTGGSLGEIAQTAADDDVQHGIETLLESLGTAGEDPERVGLVGLLKKSRNPEVQYGLGYLLAVAEALGEAQADRDT
jgi:uncharacterized protein YjgD (DUF1641 family)